MPRTFRLEALSSLYHITARGCGRRRLFEDNADCASFFQLLKRHAFDKQVGIKAWCLMENHFHLLLKGELQSISEMMHGINASYAERFNSKYGHVGHVFQGRYHSVPIETDEQLLATIRYIHLNPTKDGLAPFESYTWSSYRQYMGAKGICDTRGVCGLFENREAFRRFHADSDVVANNVDYGTRMRISDAEAAKIASLRFGKRFADEIPILPIEQRNDALKTLFRMGISVRQLERLTGIGRGIIHRACKA